ncbi:unnamed protein product [Echinostoma caproni]|uniref:MYND-type domain-containing protein n=1 Tax=Echinostoma caproni TaxID=27848 RepID=A0A183BEK0_9TREM|nr:unnamed protein product [Echinostoma caproni]
MISFILLLTVIQNLSFAHSPRNCHIKNEMLKRVMSFSVLSPLSKYANKYNRYNKRGLFVRERIHRIYADRLITLTTERDQAREEVNRQLALISQLKQDHEEELKRVKQRTWCQVCLNEALYHCCLGTAYCSKTCQWQHWEAQHSQTCRRRAEAQLLQQQQQQQQQQSTQALHKR